MAILAIQSFMAILAWQRSDEVAVLVVGLPRGGLAHRHQGGVGGHPLLPEEGEGGEEGGAPGLAGRPEAGVGEGEQGHHALQASPGYWGSFQTCSEVN